MNRYKAIIKEEIDKHDIEEAKPEKTGETAFQQHHTDNIFAKVEFWKEENEYFVEFVTKAGKTMVMSLEEVIRHEEYLNELVRLLQSIPEFSKMPIIRDMPLNPDEALKKMIDKWFALKDKTSYDIELSKGKQFYNVNKETNEAVKMNRYKSIYESIEEKKDTPFMGDFDDEGEPKEDDEKEEKPDPEDDEYGKDLEEHEEENTSEEPDEEDIIWDHKGNLSYAGKNVGVFKEFEDVLGYFSDLKDFDTFKPTAWIISDHGNAHIWQDFYQELEDFKKERDSKKEESKQEEAY